MDARECRSLADQLATRLTWQDPPGREQAERAVREAYAASGLAEPVHIAWIGGPSDARQVLARLGWRRWIPWAALACSLAAVLVDIAGRQGLGPEGRDTLVLSWNAAFAAASMVAFLGVLATERLRCANLRTVHTGLIAGAAILPMAALVGFSVHQALAAPGLLGGFLAVPTLAVIVARWREGPALIPHRPGPCLNRPIRHMMQRALRRPEQVATAPAPVIAPFRAHAWVGLMRTLAPAGLCPVELMLRNSSSMLGTPAEALHRSSVSERAALALALHVDMLWAFKRIALVLAPPEQAHVDELARLHNASGAAVRWEDGCEVFAVDGDLATDLTVMLEPDRLSVDQIRREPNPSLRRALIERFGAERLMKRLRGRKLAEDPAGELWRAADFDDEPLVMVRVVNASPEPDGSHRIYWLRVPPTVATAHEGVAWTFGLDARTYRPGQES